MKSADTPPEPAARKGPSRPGPKKSLRIEAITEAAIRIADGHGLEAVTMRSVAADVGVTAAGLYRYVASRDSLLAHMVDAVSAQVRHPEPRGQWLRELVDVAHSQRELFAAHQWLAAATSAHTQLGPAALDHLEAMLAILAPVDASAAEKFETIALVNTLAASFATAPGTARGLESVDPGRHPLLAAQLAAAGPSAPALDLFPRAVTAIAMGILGELPGEPDPLS